MCGAPNLAKEVILIDDESPDKLDKSEQSMTVKVKESQSLAQGLVQYVSVDEFVVEKLPSVEEKDDEDKQQFDPRNFKFDNNSHDEANVKSLKNNDNLLLH